MSRTQQMRDAIAAGLSPAAASRLSPCSMRMAIISTAMIASSTINPSASTSAPTPSTHRRCRA